MTTSYTSYCSQYIRDNGSCQAAVAIFFHRILAPLITHISRLQNILYPRSSIYIYMYIHMSIYMYICVYKMRVPKKLIKRESFTGILYMLSLILLYQLEPNVHFTPLTSHYIHTYIHIYVYILLPIEHIKHRDPESLG